MLAQKIFHHFVHDVDLITTALVDNDPGAAVKSTIEIRLNLDLELRKTCFRRGLLAFGP